LDSSDEEKETKVWKTKSSEYIKKSPKSTPSTPSTPTLSLKQIRSQIEAMVDEYKETRSDSEAVELLEEIKDGNGFARTETVKMCAMMSMNPKDKYLSLYPQLLIQLFNLNALSEEDIFKGYQQVLNRDDFLDLMIDVPRAPRFIATHLASSLANNMLSMSSLSKLIQPLIDGGTACSILTETILALQEMKGDSVVKEKLSEINFLSFVPEKNKDAIKKITDEHPNLEEFLS
jgi:hypothetical protein